MGRAEVTGGTDGLYQGSVIYDSGSLATAVAAIDAQIASFEANKAIIQAKLDELEPKVADAMHEFNDEVATYNLAVQQALATGHAENVTHPGTTDLNLSQAIDFVKARLASELAFDGDMEIDLTGNREYQYLLTQMKSAPDPLNSGIREAYNTLIEASAKISGILNQQRAVQKFMDLILYQQESLNRRKAQLQEASESGETQEMWCADLTEDLSGEVDTIEVKGAPDQIIVAPGGDSEFEDTKLARPMGMAASQCGLAWALLPGWQKWRPTYRVGTISNIDYEADTADVSLDDALSIAQELDVNMATDLVGIPVEYMECNASAFINGDRVVVMFPGQLWEEQVGLMPGSGHPKVIGFETNPQYCPGYAAVFASTSAFPSFNDDNIYEWRPGDLSGTPGTESTCTVNSTVPPDTKDYNNAWKKGATVRIGATWRYPLGFIVDKRFSMQIRANIIIYDEAGNTIAYIPVQADYAPSGFTAKDKSIGRWNGALFDCRYLILTATGPSYVADFACHPDIWGRGGASEIAYESDWWGYDYVVNHLNEINEYNFYYTKTHFTWVNPKYADGAWDEITQLFWPGADIHAGDWSFSLDGCDPCEGYSCSNPGIKCPGMDEIPLGDYIDVADPCDTVDEKDQLYIEQSWSMEGVVTDEGVTLYDNTIWGSEGWTVGEHQIPFGPFEPNNVTMGEIILTGQGPVEGKHHVGFSVFSINTANGEVTAIAEQSNTGSPQVPVWGNRGISTAFGFVSFYATVERPKRE